jgi:hypothetical protein
LSLDLVSEREVLTEICGPPGPAQAQKIIKRLGLESFIDSGNKPEVDDPRRRCDPT